MIALTPACDWNHKSVPALANIPVTFIGQSASIELQVVDRIKYENSVVDCSRCIRLLRLVIPH